MTSSSNQKQLSINSRKFQKKNRNCLKKNMFLIPNRKRIEKIESPKHLFHPLIHKKNPIIEIEWNQGEKEIYMKGSFGYLNKNFVSKKIEKIYMYSKFDINKQFKKLKYKVNGNIKIIFLYTLSNKQIKEKNIPLSQKNQNISISTKDSSFNSLQKSKININKDIFYSKKYYSNYFPKREEMREKADKMPSHFPMEFFLEFNKFHYDIGKKEFFDLKETNVFNSNNDSYKIIDKKDHLLLNHFFQRNYSINALTIRYRNKNTTFLYYK